MMNGIELMVFCDGVQLDDLKDVGIIDWGYLIIVIYEFYKEYVEWCLSRWGREVENLYEEVWCVCYKLLYGKLLF